MTQDRDMNAGDWVSAVSSVVAAVVAIVTLVTVYIGAMQLLSQNRMYRLGLSWRSLGPWQRLCSKWALFFLQRRISTPTVNLKSLVDGQWQPDITFPTGFPKNPKSPRDIEQGQIQAKTTWVNFMQALGIKPEDEDRYEMQDAPELVNGKVPMSWTGKDLVGLCSILGFQSHEGDPSFKNPMPLPAQWSGPLGWLQFRASSNGCVAEFRRRMDLKNQISEELHKYYSENGGDFHKIDMLRSRLWNSINGFALANDRTLFLGGTDRDKRPQDEDDELYATNDDMFRDLTSRDYPDGEIMRKLFGKREKHPKALRREVERNGSNMMRSRPGGDDGDMSGLLDNILQDKEDPANRKEVMRRCPGLLSVTVNGELAYNRGLSVDEKCREYDRKLTLPEDVDHIKYPYNLGNLYMDEELLELMKEALLLHRPDGFYFSPTGLLYMDLRDVYGHIEEQSNRLKQVFPEECIKILRHRGEPKESSLSSGSSVSCFAADDDVCLSFAMELCNGLQNTRKTARACYTVEDMKLIAKAESAVRRLVSRSPGGGEDLIWAILSCRKLSRAVLKKLEKDNNTNFFRDELTIKKQTCGRTILECPALKGCVERDENDDDAKEDDGVFRVPLVSGDKFTGGQIVAAVSVVFITYYWINKKWVTDVTKYDATMPQSVLMC
ncbi:hypothetical protein MMYC01_204357 [Madurella mycetomatis]|uniref:Uncharacterized protein n=1 Tax=Madurella mycetomatis TaxID=100816 RepID=A0A175W5S7_9PEZI|nr:hypothetical protein MMYC01_204357 [Madurella mycetomatis]